MATKYEIRVTEVHEDGTRTPHFFDAENTVDAMLTNGFAILGNIDGGSSVAIHDTNAVDIAIAINASEHLLMAAEMAPILSKLAHRKEAPDASE